MSRAPQLGSVVWAEIEDANGFRKVRPAVVGILPPSAIADILDKITGSSRSSEASEQSPDPPDGETNPSAESPS